MSVMQRIARASRRGLDHGASAVEYGLLVAAVAAVIAATVFGLGKMVAGAFQHTQDCLTQGLGGTATPKVTC